MYRDIVQTSPDGIWLVDLSGRTIHANPSMAAMLGRTTEEMADLPIQAALDERGRRDFAALVAGLESGETLTGDVEVLLHRADGSAFWALASETLLEADDGLGLPRRLLVRLADWDERRGVIQREARSRATLAEAELIAGLGSWVTDPETGEVEASDGLRRLLDLPEGPLRRAHLLEVVHHDDRHLLDSFAAADLDAQPFSYEGRMRTPSGYRWFAGRIALSIGPDGRPVRHGTIVDIHERRQAEKALEDALLQNVLLQSAAAAANEARSFEDALRLSQQLILATGDWQRARAFRPDPGGGLPVPLYVNEEDWRADEADPETLPAERALAARVVEEVRIIWSETAWHGGPMVAFPISVPGELIAVGVISSTTPIERPDMIRAVLTQAGSQMARVAERDRAAAVVAEARDDAMEASRLKSDFLATMSHEIRTPLNGVIGLNDLLLHSQLDMDQQRLVTGIQVSSRALLGIINDVLDFSKIEAGHLELEEVDFDPRSVLDQVSAVLGESARARGLDLMVGCDASVPAVLSGDPTRLAQVVTNLGSNAVKFTESGSVVIRVSRSGAAEQDGDPRTVELCAEVTDTGVGLSAEQLETIFDPFAQADASTTRRFGGTGLGLAICREIVTALGGRLGASSDGEGHGSRFWFTARFKPADGHEVSAEDQRARAALSGRRVLVVDDTEHNRLILSEQLGWWGVHCSTVSSVAEALEALRVAGPGGHDLVLLDLAMPERDGFDLAAEVRAHPEFGEVPLVMLSSTLPPEAARLREAGVAGSLTKPVLASTLRALLLRYLAPDSSPASSAASLPASAMLDREPERHRSRVLVVEDNPVNQMVASGLLDAIGYDSDVVDDGDSALQALAAGSPDRYGAVLMDLQMPRMDGFEATRALRDLERERDGVTAPLPVIAMTASAIQGERERCLEAGMDDFLTKPVDPRALAALMDRWLAPPAAGQGVPGAPAGERGHDGVVNPVAKGGSGGPAGPRERATPADPLSVAPDEEPELAPPAPRPRGPLDRDRLEMLRELDEGGDYLRRVIDRFATNRAGLVAAVGDAVADGDPGVLRSAAHSLKGTLTNLGLVHAGEIAFELEELGTVGTVVGADERLPDLRAATEEGLTLLLAYRATLDGGVVERG